MVDAVGSPDEVSQRIYEAIERKGH